jgi:hypothetical protein
MSSDISKDEKIIHNPVTGSQYKVRDHSSKYLEKKNPKKQPIINVHVKGSRIDDLNPALMFIPLKLRTDLKKHLVMCRSVLKGHLEKIGVTFSISGAFFVALPATMFNTLATNVFFFVGDIFLLSIFAIEKRNWLIVQNFIFAVLAAWGIVNNLPGVL